MSSLYISILLLASCGSENVKQKDPTIQESACFRALDCWFIEAKEFTRCVKCVNREYERYKKDITISESTQKFLLNNVSCYTIKDFAIQYHIYECVKDKK